MTYEIVLTDITNHGRHVAVLTGFADEDEYLEYRLLNDPRFQGIIRRSTERRLK